MSSLRPTSPILLDSLALSSSSSSSTSSFSFFGRDDNGVDSQTDPESPGSSPTSSTTKDSRYNGFWGGLQGVAESHDSSRMGVASPSSQATPKASSQFLKKWVEEDVGYDSGREDTKRGELVMKVKKKKKLQKLLFYEQSSFIRPPPSKAPIGLGLDSLPPRNQSTIVYATPSKPVLCAVDPLGSPSPIMSLPPLLSATRVTSKPHEGNVLPASHVSPRMLCSPLLMLLLR